jgi:hypothetical protein
MHKSGWCAVSAKQVAVLTGSQWPDDPRPGELDDQRVSGKEWAMLADLAALTPPLVVCVAFLIGVWLFLRRQMAAKDAGGDDDAPIDISGESGIQDHGPSRPAPSPDRGES